MADLVDILKKTIDGLPSHSVSVRKQVYQKARQAVERQISSARPSYSDKTISYRRTAIERAIARAEEHYLLMPAPPNIPIVYNEPIILEVERQTPNVVQFIDSLDGKIDVDTSAGLGGLLSGADAQDRYDEVKNAANELIDTYEKENIGGNSATELVRFTLKFIESLGSDVTKARPGLLIPRAEMLRQQILLQSKADDDLSGIAPLPEVVKSRLSVLVQSANIYISFDPLLSERDEARLGPDAPKGLIGPIESQRVVENAVKSGVITPAAASLLAEEAMVAPVVPDPASRTSRRYSEEVKNLIRAILSKAWSLSTASNLARAAVGTAAVGGIAVKSALWAIANETWILSTFADHHIMNGIASELIVFLKSLPLNTLG